VPLCGISQSPNTNWTNERSTAVEKYCITRPEKIILSYESATLRHLFEIVRFSVNATLNELLDAGTDRLRHADKYERSEARQSIRVGFYPIQIKKIYCMAVVIRLLRVLIILFFV
jgi:hypothetical protein